MMRVAIRIALAVLLWPIVAAGFLWWLARYAWSFGADAGENCEWWIGK